MIYKFEGIDGTLDLVPLAARRALDRAGKKVGLEAWRAAPLPVRQRMIEAGAALDVDAARVERLLADASIPSEALPAVVLDPPDDALPADLEGLLGPAIGDETWRSLSPLDRYALAKIAKKSGASDRLTAAVSEIVTIPEPALSHLTSRGEAHMVDVGPKAETLRRAVALARVRMKEETAARLRSGSVPKGDVLATARIAGIQAAKRTPELIPLCHALRLTRVALELQVESAAVRIEASAEAIDRTGVEMEALVAASTAALTVYDMLKSIERGMTIEVVLLEKRGGKSGAWEREPGGVGAV